MSGEDDNDIPASGAVFTFGKSRFADNIPSHFFIRNDPVIDIDCGDEHTALVCQNGRVFAFGSNEWGQLGLGHQSVVNKPSCLKSLKPEHAVHVACGKTHTLISTASGKLFACGNNSDGQLGVGDTTDKAILTETENVPGTIVQLSAGCLHSVALNSKGEVFVWGSNSDGQLGLGEGIKNVSIPTILQLREKISKIACGYYHSVFLTEEGQVLVCGEGESGKLGLGTNENTYVPTIVSLEAWIMFVAAGGNHTIAVGVDGTVFGWGSNYSGQLGLLNVSEKDVTIPSLIDSLTGTVIKQVSCGDRHTAFITENAELLTCGESRHGKLGYEINDTPDPTYNITPSRVTRFKSFSVFKVACGGCHTMVIASTCSNNDECSSDIPNEHMSPSKTLHPPEPEIVSPPVSGRTTLPPLQRVHVPSSNVDEPPVDKNLIQTHTQNYSPKYDNLPSNYSPYVHKPTIITSLDDNQNSNNITDEMDKSDVRSLNSLVENEKSADKSAFETISLNTSEKLISSEGTEGKVSRENINNNKHHQDCKLFKVLHNLIKIIYSKYSDKTNFIFIKPLKEFSAMRYENHKCSVNYLTLINHNKNNLKYKINKTTTAITVQENNCHFNDVNCDSEIISIFDKQKNDKYISDKYEVSELRKNRHIDKDKFKRSVSLEKLKLQCISRCSQNNTKFDSSAENMCEIPKGLEGCIKSCENITNNDNYNRNKTNVTGEDSALALTNNNQYKAEKKNQSDHIPTPKSRSEGVINNPFHKAITTDMIPLIIYDTFNHVKEEDVKKHFETENNCEDTEAINMKDEITILNFISNLPQSISDNMKFISSHQNFGLFAKCYKKDCPCFSCEDDMCISRIYFNEQNSRVICELQNVKKNIMVNNYINSIALKNCRQQCNITEMNKNGYQNTKESYSVQNEPDDQKNYFCSMPENDILYKNANNSTDNKSCVSTRDIQLKLKEIFTTLLNNMASYSHRNISADVNDISDTHCYSEEDSDDVISNSYITADEELTENCVNQQKLDITYGKCTGSVSPSKVRSVYDRRRKETFKLLNFDLTTGGRSHGKDCELACKKRNFLYEITKCENSTLAEASFLYSIKLSESSDNENNSPAREFHHQESESNELETLDKNENSDHHTQVTSGGGRLTKLLTNMRAKRSQSEVDVPHDKHQSEMTENSGEKSESDKLPAAVSNKKSKMCTIL